MGSKRIFSQKIQERLGREAGVYNHTILSLRIGAEDVAVVLIGTKNEFVNNHRLPQKEDGKAYSSEENGKSKS